MHKLILLLFTSLITLSVVYQPELLAYSDKDTWEISNTDTAGDLFKIGRELEKLFEAGRLNSIQPVIEWYEKAVDAGSPEAMNQLALIYFRGRGTEINIDRAIHLFKSSAELGNKYAQYNMGLRYDQGTGVGVDKSKAYQYYFLAAKQGFGNAQVAIADMLYMGNGVAKSIHESMIWYEKAAQNGNERAMYNIGTFLLDSNDISIALNYLHSASEIGSSEAALVLANHYESNQKPEKAFKYYLISANLGNAMAWNSLGIMYYSGIGTTKDISKSKSAFQIASSLGLEEAEDNLNELLKSIN